jgi:hypothetical protein
MSDDRLTILSEARTDSTDAAAPGKRLAMLMGT